MLVPLGYLSWTNSRWATFIDYSYSIQGRIHNVGTIAGGAAVDGTRPETKLLLFRVYRYLTVAHFMIYKSRSPHLAKVNLDDLAKLGLLTKEELTILIPSKNKQRDLVLSWVASTLSKGFLTGLLDRGYAQSAIEAVAATRGKMAGFADMFAKKQPNVWAALMSFLVDSLTMM